MSCLRGSVEVLERKYLRNVRGVRGDRGRNSLIRERCGYELSASKVVKWKEGEMKEWLIKCAHDAPWNVKGERKTSEKMERQSEKIANKRGGRVRRRKC